MAVTTMRDTPLILAIALLLGSLIHAQQPDQARFAALDKSMERAPAEQRIAYNALLVAFTTFRDAHLQHEICPTSAPCLAQQTEKSFIDNTFLSNFEHPDTVPASPTDLAAADATLNETFEKHLAAFPESCPAGRPGCLTQATFRDIERDWIRYRDAFITLIGLRSKQPPIETWSALLTAIRAHQIIQIPTP